MIRVAFVVGFWFDFLGIASLSAIVRQLGHESRVFVTTGKKKELEEILRFLPNLIAFYATTGDHLPLIRTAEFLKERLLGTTTIFGGPHATFFPDMVRRNGIDCVCRGEGEGAMADLATAIDQGGGIDHIPNLCIDRGEGEIIENPLRPLIADLDELPFPDRASFYRYPFLRDNPNKHFVTARGCPFQCTFCFNAAYRNLYKDKGKYVRRHSPERTVEEIARMKRDFPMTSVRFDDDVFILQRNWLEEFLPLYKKRIGLPFSILFHAGTGDSDLPAMLADAGCHVAYFGIESGVSELREGVLCKGVTNEQIRAAAMQFHDAGVKIGTFNMVGIPGESVDDAMKTVRLNRRIKADYVWVSIIQPYPKTKLEDIAIEKGLLPGKSNPDDFPPSYFNRSVIQNRQRRELDNLHRFFALLVRFPFLEKLILRLIKLPQNAIFDFIFKIAYGRRYVKTYKISWRRLFGIARRTRNKL